jgi:hypothetical protein
MTHVIGIGRPTLAANPCGAVQQTFAAVALWLRTAWVYVREAEHLKELDENIVEEGSSCHDFEADSDDSDGFACGGRNGTGRHSGSSPGGALDGEVWMQRRQSRPRISHHAP